MRAPTPANWARQPYVEVEGGPTSELIQIPEGVCFLRLFMNDVSWPM